MLRGTYPSGWSHVLSKRDCSLRDYLGLAERQPIIQGFRMQAEQGILLAETTLEPFSCIPSSTLIK
jgi:hypothetical protein